MAIQLQKTLPNGATGDYWRLRLCGVEIAAGSLTATWALELFASREYAQQNTACLGYSRVFSSIISAEEKCADLYALGYAKFAALEDPDFAGGETV